MTIFQTGMPADPYSGGSFSDIELLPDAEKERLCLDLLQEFGAEVSRSNDKGELIHSCVLPFGLHANGDRNPSASLNYKTLTYNCLAGETVVKTFDGERTLKDLAGGTHLLLDGKGRWVKSEVRSFGVQSLRKITLSRNGIKKVIYATPDHRWLTRPVGRLSALVERTTDELVPRMRIPSVWTQQRAGRLIPSPFGVAQGFVYGDGTVCDTGAIANFCGEKDRALLPFFAGLPVGRASNGSPQIRRGLPRSWKLELPSLDSGSSFLYGWLAGYVAADGSVSESGDVTLASSRRSNLEHVVAVCDRIGVATYGISEQVREGYGAKDSSIFTLRFRASAFTEDFFVIEQHRDRWATGQRTRQYDRTHWWVSSVEETDRIEEVYCAIVPTTHSFVLEGSILTGNCYGCGGGGLLWFIATCRGTSSTEARKWLGDQTGMGADEQSLGSLLDVLDAIYGAKGKHSAATVPKMDLRVLGPYLKIHPYMTDERHCDPEILQRFLVGYGEFRTNIGTPDEPIWVTSPRIVIPHIWRGDLVGWQSRRLIDDGTPKYVNTPDFPKDTTIYNYDGAFEPTVVVESTMSVLRHSKNHRMVATFGASVTPSQIRLLGRADRAILWFDNDEAGWKATEEVGQALSDYTTVYAVESPWAADAGDLPSDEVQRLISSAVPFSIWNRPSPSTITKWEAP